MAYFGGYRVGIFVFEIFGTFFASIIAAAIFSVSKEKRVKVFAKLFTLVLIGIFIVLFPLIFSERLWWVDMSILFSIGVGLFFFLISRETKHPIVYACLIVGIFCAAMFVEFHQMAKFYNQNLIVLNEEVYDVTKTEQYKLTGAGMNRSANVKLSDVEYGLCVVTYEDRDDCEVVWTDRYEVILNQNYREPRKEEKLAEKIITIKMPASMSEIS